MKILDSFWFSPMASPIIGIVKCENKIGEIKYYIGTAPGKDQMMDAKHISENGAKFPPIAAEKLF
jgi:hypothetical protein